MPRKLNIPLPSKGLVVDRPAEYVDERSATECRNVEVNRSVLRKRLGTASMGASLGERTMRFFELQVGALTRLFRVGTTKFQEFNKNTSVWSSATATPLTGSEDDPVSYAFPVLAGEKIAAYTNGIDAIRKVSITGNDAPLGGTPPKVKFLQTYGPYLFAANITDDGSGDSFPSRVQWPDTGDIEAWTPLSSNNAGSAELLDDPEDISGLGIFSNFLTVHKLGSIYLGQLVSTEDVIRFDRRATGVGAAAGATILTLPSGEQIFLGADGFHLFNGITAPLVEAPVQDEIREGVNPSAIHRSQGVFVPELDEAWFAVPIGSQEDPETVYRYNWRTKQIYKDTRPGLSALGLFLNTLDLTWDDMDKAWDTATERWDSNSLSSLSRVAVFGTSAGASTKRTPGSNDDAGTAVDARWETKDFGAADLGEADFDRVVRWSGLEVWALGTALDVEYSTDGGMAWTAAGTLALGTDYQADSAPGVVYFDVVSSRIRFRFSNDDSEGTFTLKKYQVEGTVREGRK